MTCSDERQELEKVLREIEHRLRTGAAYMSPERELELRTKADEIKKKLGR